MVGSVGSGPWTCPGSSALRNPTLELVPCPYCGEENEAFTDELRIVCTSCGKTIDRNRSASCIDWCAKAEDCLGADLVAKFKGGKP